MLVPYMEVPLAYVAKRISVNPDELIALDIETCGEGYNTIALVQFYAESWEEVLLVEFPDKDKLALLVKNTYVVGHAISYEFRKIGVVADKFECTHMSSKLEFFQQEKFALDNCYVYALGYDPYLIADLDKKVMQKTNWGGELTDKHRTYASIDVYYLIDLWKATIAQAEEDSYQLDKITIRHCNDMELRGVPLKCLALEEKQTRKELESIEAVLPCNPRSPQQVKSYLNITGSTGADELAGLEQKGGEVAERAKMVRESRVLSKYLSTYVSKMVGKVRWYGTFAPSTRSGRLASKENNLQNLPRKMKKFMGFEAYQERVVISADWAQLELRTIAAIANDTKMIELFRRGVDVHGYMAELMFGTGYTKEQRTIAKTANFSLLYGASAATYAKMLLKQTGIVITEANAQTLKRKWLSTWTGIARWQQDGIRKWKQGHYGFTPMGRRYKAKMMTDFLSIENQGAGAECAKLAFHYIYDGFKFEDSFMFNFIHDSYQADAPNVPSIYEPIAELFADSIQEAWKQFSVLVPRAKLIPMSVDVGVALTFAEADDMADSCIYKVERT